MVLFLTVFLPQQWHHGAGAPCVQPAFPGCPALGCLSLSLSPALGDSCQLAVPSPCPLSQGGTWYLACQA